VAHQLALTVVAEVRPDAEAELRQLLETMGDGVANRQVVDLDALTGLHFARFVLVEQATDLADRQLPASLLYLSDIDVPKEQHLAELAARNGAGIDQLFGHCVGYPSPPGSVEDRLEYLREHIVKEQARYVNTVGRSARQIQAEAVLRERVERHVDEHIDEPVGRNAEQVRAEARRLIERDPELQWARRAAEKPELSFRLRELAHAIAMPLLVVLLSPLLLVGLPVFLVLLRTHERRDPAPHEKPSPELVEELASLEDHLVHNPFTAVGLVKPGLFRKLTLLAVLTAIDYGTRHIWNRGNLAGVKTIHFARWVFLDGRRRMVFASNYDGSLENYMDDFIDKIAWGLNIVFSNGYGFPRALFLVFAGAHDELAFKDFLRLHQVPTRAWHSSYGRLTTANIANNEALRAGLQEAEGREQPEQWLRTV
jgi:hypothetical protein